MEETKQRIKEWAEAYIEEIHSPDESLFIRIRYGWGHHYRDWLDDRADRKEAS